MILYAGCAFIITLIATPRIIRLMKQHGITGKDVHKPVQPDIPEMGGLSYIMSLIVVFSFAFLLLDDVTYVVVLLVVLISALIGAYDDLKGLQQMQKVILSFAVGVPLLFLVEDTSVNFLFFSFDFSWSYYILVVLAVSACSNATNILAGFNGEEAGMGAIASLSLGICCIILDRAASQLLLFSLSASLMAFLIFNRYPAHTFPGDIGTLPIGALIAGAVILGKIELLGFVVLLPAILEFFLKLRISFKGKQYGPTTVKKGILYPPPYISVANVFTQKFKLTEKALVYTLWTLEGFFGFISISTALLIR